MAIAFLYAGQGAQYTGMGQDLLNHHPEIATYFDKASEVLGYSMQDLCFHHGYHFAGTCRRSCLHKTTTMAH